MTPPGSCIFQAVKSFCVGIDTSRRKQGAAPPGVAGLISLALCESLAAGADLGCTATDLWSENVSRLPGQAGKGKLLKTESVRRL